jgi:peptide/nickel transport system substrate-binding protein
MLLLCFLISCNSNEVAPPPIRQNLVVCLAKNPLMLDPRYHLDAASHRLTQVMFNGLVRKGPQMTLIPDVAERWELEDETTWVFYIRENIAFHNGRNLTAEDVAYTYESILDPVNESPKRLHLEMVERIEVRDPQTVVFRTREPFAPLPVNLTVGIVPEKEAREMGRQFSTMPIGTGPYKFIGQDPGQRIQLAAFDRYFRGSPPISSLTFRVVADDTARYLELIKGHVDVVQNALDPDMIPVVENRDEFQVVKTPGTNYEYLAFNLADPILKHRDVRAAIAHALDIPFMLNTLLRGEGVPASGLLPPGHWAYEPDVARYSYHPDTARKLLDQAGYPVKQDGWRFSLIYKTGLSDQARLKAEAIQAGLKEVGIKLDIRGYDWDTLFNDIKSGNFQIVSQQWVGVSEPDIYHYVFHSDSFPPKGANRGHYNNPELDRLIERGRRTHDQAERRAIYSEIQKIVAYDLPYVSLWHPNNVLVMNRKLKGFYPYPDGDLSDLWKIRWDGSK